MVGKDIFITADVASVLSHSRGWIALNSNNSTVQVQDGMQNTQEIMPINYPDVVKFLGEEPAELEEANRELLAKPKTLRPTRQPTKPPTSNPTSKLNVADFVEKFTSHYFRSPLVPDAAAIFNPLAGAYDDLIESNKKAFNYMKSGIQENSAPLSTDEKIVSFANASLVMAEFNKILHNMQDFPTDQDNLDIQAYLTTGFGVLNNPKINNLIINKILTAMVAILKDAAERGIPYTLPSGAGVEDTTALVNLVNGFQQMKNSPAKSKIAVNIISKGLIHLTFAIKLDRLLMSMAALQMTIGYKGSIDQIAKKDLEQMLVHLYLNIADNPVAVMQYSYLMANAVKYATYGHGLTTEDRVQRYLSQLVGIVDIKFDASNPAFKISAGKVENKVAAAMQNEKNDLLQEINKTSDKFVGKYNYVGAAPDADTQTATTLWKNELLPVLDPVTLLFDIGFMPFIAGDSQPKFYGAYSPQVEIISNLYNFGALFRRVEDKTDVSRMIFDDKFILVSDLLWAIRVSTDNDFAAAFFAIGKDLIAHEAQPQNAAILQQKLDVFLWVRENGSFLFASLKDLTFDEPAFNKQVYAEYTSKIKQIDELKISLSGDKLINRLTALGLSAYYNKGMLPTTPGATSSLGASYASDKELLAKFDNQNLANEKIILGSLKKLYEGITLVPKVKSHLRALR